MDGKTKFRAGAIVLFALLAVLLGCRNGAKTRARSASEQKSESRSWKPSRVAEIFFSTELAGHIEPCGCTENQLGGLQKLATVIKSGSEHRGLIDAGNLLFPPSGISHVTHDQHVLKARVIARAYRQLGAVALNVAEADLSEGTAFLKELQREGSVPFVSANVVPVGSSGPAVARSFLRTIGGIKIGVTGAATPESVAATSKAITVLEHAPSLKAEVKALRGRGAEVIVVLAHLSESGARELATTVPDIDVIIRAPGTSIEREPSGSVRVGNVVIAESGRQGQYVGRLTLRMGPTSPKRPLVLADDGQQALRKRRLIARQIKAYRMEEKLWSVDPSKVEAVKAKRAQIQRLEDSLKEPMPKTEPPAQPHLAISVLPLGEAVSADLQMEKLMAGYYAELKGMNADKGDPALCHQPDKKKPVFVGTQKCIDCHEEAYALWKNTKHATAWQTLENEGKHFDLTCVGCHAVGYQEPGGFCKLKNVGELKNVGCESCHGPGSVHVKDEKKSSIVLKSTEYTCTQGCHTREHSDGFAYGEYLQKITGPGHVLSKD